MSSFRGNNLFGSGPHRFTGPARELVVIPLWVIQNTGFDDAQGSAVLGEKERIIQVTGRLTAPDEPTLWSRRQAVAVEATMPQKTGDLIDNFAHTHPDMTMVSYEELGPVHRGRLWSIPYRATFRNVKN